LNLWNADTGRLQRTVTLPPTCRVQAARPSRSGRWLALVGRRVDDVGLWLLDLADDHAAPVAGLSDVTALAFEPEDRWLLCAADGGVFRLPLPPPASAGPPVLVRPVLALPHEAAAAPDGRAAAVLDGDARVIRVWRADVESVAAVPLPAGWVGCGLGLSAGGR